jgi:hypothetical protein
MRSGNAATGLYPWAGKNQGGGADSRAPGRRGGPGGAQWPRLPLAAGCLALLLAGCAGPRLEFAGAPGQPALSLAEAGLRLTLRPNTWDGYPTELRRYYTPIELHIENDRAEGIQIGYQDFLAVDEAQIQYRAVAPSEVVRALYGSPRPGRGPGPLLASSGPWWPSPGWPVRPWYPYGPYYPSGPWPYPYDYSPWPPAAGYDILARALREGSVLPGGRVEGFLYLQLATQRASTLTLSWAPKGPSGQPLATLQAQFRVIR